MLPRLSAAIAVVLGRRARPTHVTDRLSLGGHAAVSGLPVRHPDFLCEACLPMFMADLMPPFLGAVTLPWSLLPFFLAMLENLLVSLPVKVGPREERPILLAVVSQVGSAPALLGVIAESFFGGPGPRGPATPLLHVGVEDGPLIVFLVLAVHATGLELSIYDRAPISRAPIIIDIFFENWH